MTARLPLAPGEPARLLAAAPGATVTLRCGEPLELPEHVTRIRPHFLDHGRLIDADGSSFEVQHPAPAVGSEVLVGPPEHVTKWPSDYGLREHRNRILRAAMAWLDHADAACEQDDELVELAKATRAFLDPFYIRATVTARGAAQWCEDCGGSGEGEEFVADTVSPMPVACPACHGRPPWWPTVTLRRAAP
jgi:hypothetical protein